MGPKAEELLNLLLWSVDTLARPTFRNLSAGYEGWAYRTGLLKQTARLEQRKLIERNSNEKNDRLYRLSARGRLEILGGRDPEDRWGRKWDGRWRLVLFDIPIGQNAQRERLRRYLRSKGFGYLQNSVWVTPDPLEQERQVLTGGKIDVESLILLEAVPCAGESEQQIVAGAWDFDGINRSYARYLNVLDQRPTMRVRNTAAAKVLLEWGRREREAWLAVITKDPLLPARILPADYLGQRAWRERVKVLRIAGRQFQSFKRD